MERAANRLALVVFVAVLRAAACQPTSPAAPDLDDQACSDAGCDTDTGTGPCEPWECAPEEDQATCEAATTEAECEEANAAIQPGGSDDGWQTCDWTEFVEILPGFAHECGFGETRFRCVHRSGGEEGCEGSSPACGQGEPYVPDGWRSIHYVCDDGKLFMTVLPCGTSSCTYGECLWSENGAGVLTDGIDECECACDPDLPL